MLADIFDMLNTRKSVAYETVCVLRALSGNSKANFFFPLACELVFVLLDALDTQRTLRHINRATVSTPLSECPTFLQLALHLATTWASQKWHEFLRFLYADADNTDPQVFCVRFIACRYAPIARLHVLAQFADSVPSRLRCPIAALAPWLFGGVRRFSAEVLYEICKLLLHATLPVAVCSSEDCTAAVKSFLPDEESLSVGGLQEMLRKLKLEFLDTGQRDRAATSVAQVLRVRFDSPFSLSPQSARSNLRVLAALTPRRCDAIFCPWLPSNDGSIALLLFSDKE
jgi:hypothetical protein